MPRKKLTITIEEKILNQYKKYCEKNAINISRKVEQHMKKDMKKKQ